MTDTQTDILAELKMPKEDGFRFKNQKALLTYKTHLDKANYTAWLQKEYLFTKYLYIAHECGLNDPRTPYEHTHVVVDFGKAWDKKNCRCFDFEGIHPHISLITKMSEWKKACNYITKEDRTVVLDPENAPKKYTPINGIWSNDSLADALENCTLKDAIATIAVYKAKPMELPEPEITEDMFYPWQKDFWELLQQDPDNRTVRWIADPPGKSGKTRFAKWACLMHPDKCVMLNNVGKISDFAMNMQTFWSNGWRGDTVFLNLSRSYCDRTQIYEAVEIISDGYITCTKYTGGVVWLPKMHVVVLANFLPQLEKLSEDRWDLFEIREQLLCNIRLNEAAQKFRDRIK